MSVPLPSGYHRVSAVGVEATPGDATIAASPASPRRGRLQCALTDNGRIYGIDLWLWVEFNATTTLRVLIQRPDFFTTGQVLSGPGTFTDNNLGSGTADGQLLHLALDGSPLPHTGGPWAGETHRPDINWSSALYDGGDTLRAGFGEWVVIVEDLGSGAGGTFHYARLDFIIKDDDGMPGVSNNGYDFGTSFAGGTIVDDPTPEVITPGVAMFSAIHVGDDIGYSGGMLQPEGYKDSARAHNERVPGALFSVVEPTLRSVSAYLDGGGGAGSAAVTAAIFSGDDGTLLARSHPLTIAGGASAAWHEFDFTGVGRGLPLVRHADSLRNRHDGGSNLWALYWLSLEVAGDPIVRAYTFPVPAQLVTNSFPASYHITPPNFTVTGGRGTLTYADNTFGVDSGVRCHRSSTVAVGEYLGLITDKFPLDGDRSTFSFGVNYLTNGTTIGGGHGTNDNNVEFYVRWYDASNVLVHTDTWTDVLRSGFDSFPVAMTQEGLSVPATATQAALEVRWFALGDNAGGGEPWQNGVVGDTADLVCWAWYATPGPMRSLTYAQYIDRFDIGAAPIYNYRTNSVPYETHSYGMDAWQGPYKALADADTSGYKPSAPAFVATTTAPSVLPTSSTTPLVRKPVAFITGEDDLSTLPPPPGPPTAPLPTMCVVGTGLGQTIPDADPSSPVYIDFDFTGIVGTITDLSISLYVTHTFVSDLSIVLFAPGVPNAPADPINVPGQVVDLIDGQGGGGEDYGSGTGPTEALVITTHAVDQMPFGDSTYAPWAGDGFLPTGDGSGTPDLTSFNGVPVDGVWRLRFHDNAGGDEGIAQWAKMCVTLAGGGPPPAIIPPYKAPFETEDYYARLPYHEAQSVFRSTEKRPETRRATVGWHGSNFEPIKWYCAIARADGPLADLVGERVEVLADGPPPKRSIVVYVRDALPLDSGEDLSLTRRAYLALNLLWTDTLTATITPMA